jgi:hypothetical protein
MPFNLDYWRQMVRQDVEHLAQDPVGALHYAGITSLYGFLLGSAVFPVVAAYAVEPQAAMTTLLGIVGGVGGNLVANWIQTKHDKAQIYRVVAEEAQQPNLAPIYDAIAEQVKVFPLAEQALIRADELQVLEQLHDQLRRLGKLNSYLSSAATIQQSGTLNITHSTNYGPTVSSISGNGPTYIATNQVITNSHLERSPKPLPSSQHNRSQESNPSSQDEIEHKRGLITELKRRQYILERQAARHGASTAPEITLEIEDLHRQIKKIQNDIGE